MIKLVDNNASAGVSEFQWSTSEQVWPFEKDKDGNTLYCKEVNTGALPSAGNSYTSHGINASKVFKFYGMANQPSTGNSCDLPACFPGSEVACFFEPSSIHIYNGSDWSSYSTSRVRVIYFK